MRITEPYTIFLRTLKSGRKVYYYQFRDENGRRSPAYSCGTDKLSVARRYCQRLYNSGEFAKFGGISFAKFSEGFFDEGSEFCRWKEINGGELSPTSRRNYVSMLKNQILPYFGEMPIARISTDTMKKWILWMTERWSAKTSNNAQTVLNLILRSAHEKKVIREIPGSSLLLRKVVRKERKLLTAVEISAIYRSELWPRECARRAFLVCAITGMRIGEVVGLQSFEVSEDRLNVEHSFHQKFGLGPTKTRVCRYVPIPKSLRLRESCGSKWAFQNDGGERPVSADYVYKKLIAICDALGIDRKGRGITIHSLRNFFISYLQAANVPESKIKAVVGHTDNGNMTEHYTYWTPEMFPEIYEVQEKLYREITGESGDEEEKKTRRAEVGDSDGGKREE